MTDRIPVESDDRTPEERQALQRVLTRIARNADAIDQVLETVELLANSGALAGFNAVLDEFDDNFNAATRPDIMSMVTNGMMLLGMLSELHYQPFFDLTMNAPSVMNEAYPQFRRRTEPLSMRETIGLLRSPEVAGMLELMVAVLRAQHTSGGKATPPLPRTPGR